MNGESIFPEAPSIIEVYINILKPFFTQTYIKAFIIIIIIIAIGLITRRILKNKGKNKKY